MRKPDFFIVGAPKCGTTAMNQYLAAHPDIFMAKKEIHFFGSDLRFARLVRRPTDVESYLKIFEGWQNQKRVGEASVWYLYSQTAAQEIHDFAPDSQIIIMLRNPIDMLYSNYFQMRYNGNEDITTFEDALAAETDRKRGLRYPSTVRHYGSLYYRETAKFCEQVQRYFDVFGRECVQVIIFDDFKADTAHVYRDTLAFLDVDANFTVNFNIVNPNKFVKSEFVRNLGAASNGLNARLRIMWRAAIPNRVRKSVSRRVRHWNTNYVIREPMQPETRRRLADELLSEIEGLSHLLGRDLTYWCRSE